MLGSVKETADCVPSSKGSAVVEELGRKHLLACPTEPKALLIGSQGKSGGLCGPANATESLVFDSDLKVVPTLRNPHASTTTLPVFFLAGLANEPGLVDGKVRLSVQRGEADLRRMLRARTRYLLLLPVLLSRI